jgi:hypothetical protein
LAHAGDFAVTFTDRYGNEIGQRGRIQGDSVPVDEMPDYVIKRSWRQRTAAFSNIMALIFSDSPAR